MIKVALIDDKPGTRLPLQDYLSRDKSNFKKIYTYNSVDTFLSDAYKHGNLDIIILDMHLSIGIPSTDGLKIIQGHKALRKVKIMMLTALSDNNYSVFKLLCNSVSSYIDKETSLYNIKEAIISLHQKGPLVRKSLLNLRPKETDCPHDSDQTPGALLTFREKQIIQGIIDRESEYNICSDLDIEPYLLRRYVRSAYRKILHYTEKDIPFTAILKKQRFKQVG